MTSAVDENRMPLLEHLRELRTRVITSMWTLVLSMSVCYIFANDIFAWLVKPMNDALHETGRGTLATTQALEGFMVQMKVAGLAGLFLASPVIFLQIWKFVAPGLYEHERRWVLPLVTASTTLFLSGAGFAYAVVFQYGFPVFLEMTPEDVQAVLSIDSYLNMATMLLVAFGASFQLPVVIYFLARLGIIDHLDLIRGFRYGMVIIFVVAAVLTPPDVVSQLLMAGPLILLYGVGIVVARFSSTKKRELTETAPS